MMAYFPLSLEWILFSIPIFILTFYCIALLSKTEKERNKK